MRETSVPGSILLLPTTVTKADTEMHFPSGALHGTGPTIHQVPLQHLLPLPGVMGTVSFSQDTTLTYSCTEEGMRHLKTATLPRIDL